MKILVLGESDTSGSRTGGISWPGVLQERLEAAGELVAMDHATFIPTGERAPDIAAKRVAEHQPDLVLLPVGAWAFTTTFVWLRVQRLFGERAGRWFRDMEQAVDGATYEKGSLRGRLNRFLRAAAHRLIGAEAITTRAESTGVYVETINRLAREEALELIAVPYARRRAVYNDPRQARERQLFMDAVRATVEARHFLWLDPEEVVPGGSDAAVAIQSDDLHTTTVAAKATGELVAERYLSWSAERQRAEGTGA